MIQDKFPAEGYHGETKGRMERETGDPAPFWRTSGWELSAAGASPAGPEGPRGNVCQTSANERSIKNEKKQEEKICKQDETGSD